MAEPDPKTKTEDAAKDSGNGDLLGSDDDLMDLFEDDDDVNEELGMLTEGLDEVDMGELLAQVRDIRGILDRR